MLPTLSHRISTCLRDNEAAMGKLGRTFRVERTPDLRPDAAGLDWRLYTYGPGHWCVGEGHSGTFRSEAEAIAAGIDWIETGRDLSTRRAA